MKMYIVWTILLVIFVIAEAATAQLVSIWFVAGSVASLISVAMHAPLWLQIMIFFIVSTASIFASRPLVKKLSKSNDMKNNIDRFIGRSSVVKERIDNLNATGCIEIDGISWTARSEDDSIIEEGSVVEIVKIEGVKAIVRLQSGV